MHPVLFKIGGVSINSYGLMIGIGIVAAVLMSLYRAKRRGFDEDIVFNVAFYGIIGGVIGAKLLYLLQMSPYLIKDFSLIGDMLLEGFVVYGGIIGGIITGYFYCRFKKVSFLEHFDLLVPSLALAQGFGRIGCFFAGCCYGRHTESPFGIEFNNSFIAPHDIKLIPTQIISSVGDFLIAAILLSYSRNHRQKGKTSGLYLILYSIGRFVVEYLRDDPRGNVGIFSTSQFICIFILVIGLIIYNIGNIKAPASH